MTTVASAIFDDQSAAQRAVSDLRAAGVPDSALSVIAHNSGTITTSDADGAVTDENHTSILRGILGGGALGAGLAVAALAIPGVGPLVAAGAIAASAVPGALAVGAVAGAAVGTLNETLLKHGVTEEDATYYGERMQQGGVIVTVDNNDGSLDAGQIREILYDAGGQSASRTVTA